MRTQERFAQLMAAILLALCLPCLASRADALPVCPLVSAYDVYGREAILTTDGETIVPYSEHIYDVDLIQPDIYRMVAWQDMECCALYNARTGQKTDFVYRMARGSEDVDGLILVLSIDGGYGYIDTDFQEVIPCQYDDAQPFSCGVAWIETEEWETGFIDQTGAFVLRPESGEWTYAERFSEGLCAVYSSDTELQGYVDLTGRVVLPMQYTRATDFKDGKALVSDAGGGCFFIARDGTPINQERYDDARSFVSHYAAVQRDGRWGFIDREGKRAVDCLYVRVLDANDNDTAWVFPDWTHYFRLNLITGEQQTELFTCAADDEYLPAAAPWAYETYYALQGDVRYYESRDKIGLKSADGAVLIDACFDSAMPFIGGLAVVSEMDNFGLKSADGAVLIDACFDSAMPFIGGLAVVSEMDNFGLIDTNGAIVLPLEYAEILRRPEGYLLRQDTQWGFADAQGNILIPPEYDELLAEGETLSVANYGEGGGMGVIDRAGRALIPLIYDTATPLQNGWSRVARQEDSLYNFVNEQGEYLLDSFCDYCAFLSGGFFAYTDAQGVHIVDGAGAPRAERAFASVTDLGLNGMLFVRDLSGYAFFDARTGVLAPCPYIEARAFSEGRAAVFDGQKWGYIDESLSLVIPCQYDDAGAFSEGFVAVYQGKTAFYINADGARMDDQAWEKALPFSEGLAAVRVQGKWGFIDAQGGMKIEPFLSSPYESGFEFVNGFCATDPADPFANTYFDREGQIITTFDVWDLLGIG